MLTYNKINRYIYKFLLVFIILFNSVKSYSQSDVDRILKGGEIIINGLTLLKKDKTQNKRFDAKIIESICVHNKIENKLTFIMTGKDENGIEIKKELVIQQSEKECVFEIPKGIYIYKIVLTNNEIFRQGEYQFEDELTIIVK
jgi:hypothetical protein